MRASWTRRWPRCSRIHSNGAPRRASCFATSPRCGVDGDALPNVGAIAHVGRVTAANLAALKPHFVVRSRGQFRTQLLLCALVYMLGFHAVALLWRLRGISGDRLLLAAVHLLTGIGFAMLVSRPDPLRDSLLFVRYAETATLGLAVMGALSCIDFTGPRLVDLSYVPLAGALSLSLLLVVFGSGPGASGAKVNLGPLQPVEVTRLLLALFLAGYFARRWELLRLRRRMFADRPLPAWINVPRAEYFLPCSSASAPRCCCSSCRRILARRSCCAACFCWPTPSRAAGSACPQRVWACSASGSTSGYRLHVSTTLAERVRIWQSPWDNAAAGGDQVAHAIWALATGKGHETLRFCISLLF